MKVHKYFKIIFIVVFYIFSSLLVSTGYGRDINESSFKKSDFAFVINFDEGPDSDKTYLLGKYPSGINITLLHKDLAKTCSAQTTTNVIRVDSSGTDITEIKGTCVKQKIYKLAIINNSVENYKPVKPKRITDPERISAFDKKAKRSKALLYLKKNNQDGEIMDLQNIIGNVPQVSYFEIPPSEIYIISYHDNGENILGPRVAIHKGGIYPLTGWCSYEALYVFLLNNEYYVQSGSFCCGCGVTTIELFKVSPSGIIKLYSDSSLSD